MLSINDLPEEYLLAMQNLLGDSYNAYIETLSRQAFNGIRFNLLKIKNENFIDLIGKDLKKIPWIDNGYYTEKGDGFSRHPYYYAGLYYLQEPSAMTPASLMDIKPGDRVLDLCAAPGGKSTEIGARLQGRGVLYSNDISASRAKALLKNIELFGIGNAMISCENPERLAEYYPEYFDHILVDAPCSGEGMFRKDSAILQAYKKRGPEYFAPIQDEILRAAARMLKPGGDIIYSTCTYSVLEDEGSVERFLYRHGDFTLEEISLKEGFEASKYFGECVRLFPHKLEGEGHFIAKLRKRGFTGGRDSFSNTGNSYREREYKEKKHKSKAVKKNFSKTSKTKLPQDCLDFLLHIDREWDEERFFQNREYIYYLPENTRAETSLHYLRTGLLLGRMKGERFEPSQALAMHLSSNEWDYPLLLSLEDERVLRYLKGESLETEDEYKGYRLVCVDSYPLGFVKQDKHRCKNKYYPGWRWNG